MTSLWTLEFELHAIFVGYRIVPNFFQPLGNVKGALSSLACTTVGGEQGWFLSPVCRLTEESRREVRCSLQSANGEERTPSRVKDPGA